MYNFTNLATWVHLGYLCGTPGWLHDKCHVAHSFWKLSISLKLSPSSYLYVCFIVHFKDDDTKIKIKNVCFFSLYYLNLIYCVIFSYIQFTFTQTSECFLSNETKNMHILGSVPELQAVRFGYVFRRKLKKSRGVALS